MEILIIGAWLLCGLIAGAVAGPGNGCAGIMLGFLLGPFGILIAAIIGNRTPPVIVMENATPAKPEPPPVRTRLNWPPRPIKDELRRPRPFWILPSIGVCGIIMSFVAGILVGRTAWKQPTATVASNASPPVVPEAPKAPKTSPPKAETPKPPLMPMKAEKSKPPAEPEPDQSRDPRRHAWIIGEHITMAKFLRFANGVVYLENDQGIEFNVKMSELNPDDQSWIRHQAWKE